MILHYTTAANEVKQSQAVFTHNWQEMLLTLLDLFLEKKFLFSVALLAAAGNPVRKRVFYQQPAQMKQNLIKLYSPHYYYYYY